MSGWICGFSSPSSPSKKNGAPNQNGIAPILGAMMCVSICCSNWCFLQRFQMFVAFEYVMMILSSSWFRSVLMASFSSFAIEVSSLWAGLFGWCGTCTNSLLVLVLLLLKMYCCGALVTCDIVDFCAFSDCVINILRREWLMCPLFIILWKRNSVKCF